MKKLFSAACAASLAMMLMMSSCCGKGGCTVEDDDAVSKVLTDSISMIQGSYIGQAVLSNYPMMQREGNVPKEDILKGIQLVLGADNSRGTQIGMQFGLQMINEMNSLETLGIKVDRHMMLEFFKKAFLQDTVDQAAAQQTYALYEEMINRVQEEKKAREEARIAQSPEALKNVADGEAYVAATKQTDPAYTTSSTGLVYKIETEGDGKPVDGVERIKVKYVEKKIDGTVIVETSETGRTTYLSTVVPGFAEGLKMLKNGGKAVFIVPGELAYGVNGIPSRQVGPNETIVYEAEVVDVE